VCPAPRGILHDPAADALLVACADGELMSLPRSGGAPRLVLRDRDLRDLAVIGQTLMMTRFREATLLRMPLAGTRAIAGPTATVVESTPIPGADVAWRMIAAPGGDHVLVTCQNPSPITIGTQQAAVPYYGNQLISTSVVAIDESGTTLSNTPVPSSPLPVDIAVPPSGSGGSVVAAGGNGHLSPETTTAGPIRSATPGSADTYSAQTQGSEVTSVAFTPSGTFLAQSREPATLFVIGSGATHRIALSPKSVADTGHVIFHATTDGEITCAGCHPEGGDDGHTWHFDVGDRRSPSMRGTLEGTAPYHWTGDMADIPDIGKHIYTERMGGSPLATEQSAALTHWLYGVAAPPAPAVVDSAAVARGATLFADAKVGCGGCHSGSKMTNNQTMNVGTGGAFQVPSLVGLHARAPYMHTGCAANLRARFRPDCGGNAHGDVSGLDSAQLDDLVAYLESL
jgi:hypothetical protein